MARQATRMKDLIAFARARSRFYSRLYRTVPEDVTEIQELPPVSKPELMANFDDWVTDPEVTMSDVEAFVADQLRVGHLFRDRYAVWATSGTTGVPGIFVHDSDALRVYATLAIWRGVRAWMPPASVWTLLRRGVRAAIVIATGGHYAGSAVKELARRSHPWLSENVRAFSVLAPISEMVAAMNEFQPTILVGYPTATMLLAQQQEAGKLGISPALIVTAAECLTQSAREQITRAFGCPVRDSYAASEFMGIAFTCDHDRLHVNADWVILEPVDENRRPIPPGQASHTLLLTNLINHVQPIIRYDLGDSITVDADPCPCKSGLPTIQLYGRRDDILHLLAPGGESIPILPMALAAVVEEEPGVQRYQILQTAPATLSIRIEATPGANSLQVKEAVARGLREYLIGQGLPSIEIEQSPEPPRRDPVSGKYRQVWANLEVVERMS